MTRPANCNRIHFSCDGTIAITERIDPELIRDGDTASALDLNGDGPFFWRCARGLEIAWRKVEAWSPERAHVYVGPGAADLVCIVSDDEILLRQVES
jgi:hypothetical protein